MSAKHYHTETVGMGGAPTVFWIICVLFFLPEYLFEFVLAAVTEYIDWVTGKQQKFISVSLETGKFKTSSRSLKTGVWGGLPDSQMGPSFLCIPT